MSLSDSFTTVTKGGGGIYSKTKEANPHLLNIGKKWETADEKLLLARITEGKTHQQIANEFLRTVGAVTSRLVGMAAQMVRSGMSMAAVKELTGVSQADIEERIQRDAFKEASTAASKKKDVAPPAFMNNNNNNDNELVAAIRELTETTREMRDMMKKFFADVDRSSGGSNDVPTDVDSVPKVIPKVIRRIVLPKKTS